MIHLHLNQIQIDYFKTYPFNVEVFKLFHQVSSKYCYWWNCQNMTVDINHSISVFKFLNLPIKINLICSSKSTNIIPIVNIVNIAHIPSINTC